MAYSTAQAAEVFYSLGKNDLFSTPQKLIRYRHGYMEDSYLLAASVLVNQGN